MEAQIGEDKLSEATHQWAALRLSSFPLWEFEDIWDEAYLQACGILKLQDPNRGNLNTFLRLRLYERVRPQYLKDLGHVLTRKRVNGKYETRSSYPFARSLKETDVLHHVQDSPIEIPDSLSLIERRTVDLMMRGLSQVHVSRMEGVSESAIASRLKRMRTRLYD